jgi:hypothetical protein
MGCTRIKKYNHKLMVYRESTRHYWRTLGEFGESCEVHPPLVDLYHLLLALALVVRAGCLLLERFPELKTISDEMDELPQLKQRLLLFPWLDDGKLGLGPCCCCCWGCGVGGRLNRACWGGLATHLPGRLFRAGARVAVFWTNPYLGKDAFEGPVGVSRFFSARWAEMQSS